MGPTEPNSVSKEPSSTLRRPFTYDFQAYYIMAICPVTAISTLVKSRSNLEVGAAFQAVVFDTALSNTPQFGLYTQMLCYNELQTNTRRNSISNDILIENKENE